MWKQIDEFQNYEISDRGEVRNIQSGKVLKPWIGVGGYTDICDSKEFSYACTSKATISKMEQVDKDINARSKDEPQTDDPYEYEIKALHKDYVEPYVKIEDEPQTERSE